MRLCAKNPSEHYANKSFFLGSKGFCAWRDRHSGKSLVESSKAR